MELTESNDSQVKEILRINRLERDKKCVMSIKMSLCSSLTLTIGFEWIEEAWTHHSYSLYSVKGIKESDCKAFN